MNLLPLFTNQVMYYLTLFKVLDKKIFQLIRYSDTHPFIIANVYVFCISMIICTACDLIVSRCRSQQSIFPTWRTSLHALLIGRIDNVYKQREQIHKGAFSCDIDISTPRLCHCLFTIALIGKYVLYYSCFNWSSYFHKYGAFKRVIGLYYTTSLNNP